MLDGMLAQLNNVYQQERVRNDMLMLKLTELVLVELARYNYALPCGDPLPDDDGGTHNTYKDTITLWYVGETLHYEFYYPSRGTGDATQTGRFADASTSVQNRTFRLLYTEWRQLACESRRRMGSLIHRAQSELQAGQAARQRDAENRKQLQARHARPVQEPPAVAESAETVLADEDS